MKVILRDDVKNVGTAGQVIEVKPGFARNYLVPQGLAYAATPANLKTFENETHLKSKKLVEIRREAEARKAEIEKVSLTAAVKVGEDEKLFGSVTTHTIADLLKEKGYEFNHRKILLSEPIKELGVFEVGVDLAPGVEAKVKLWVVKE